MAKKKMVGNKGHETMRVSSLYTPIGKKDFHIWREKYGWDGDQPVIQSYFKKRKFRNGLKRLHRKHAGLVRLTVQERHPFLAMRANRLVKGAKVRASVIRVPFDINAEWVLERLIAGKCEVTGIPFDFARDRREPDGERRMFAPSLDQRVPRGGYTKENIQVVVWCYNAAKGSGTDADVLKMAEALVEFTRQKNITEAA